MAMGPGKYDELATIVRELAGASGVVLIVLGGERGPGFSVQAPVDITSKLPALLRAVADSLELDFRELEK